MHDAKTNTEKSMKKSRIVANNVQWHKKNIKRDNLNSKNASLKLVFIVFNREYDLILRQEARVICSWGV